MLMPEKIVPDKQFDSKFVHFIDYVKLIRDQVFDLYPQVIFRVKTDDISKTFSYTSL